MESVLKYRRADDITARVPACYRLSDHAERCEQSVIDFDSLSHGLAHGECGLDPVGRRPHAVLITNARQKICKNHDRGELAATLSGTSFDCRTRQGRHIRPVRAR